MNEQERKLREEILDDAKRKAERTLARAKREADEARKQVATEQQAERDQALQRAAERAQAQSRSILATVDQEVRLRRLAAREEIIERSLDEALAGARGLAVADAQQSLAELLAEALEALGDGAVTVRVNPKSVAALKVDSAKVTVVADETVADGLIATSADGRRQFDNTYAMRRKRLRERLRTLLADGIEF